MKKHTKEKAEIVGIMLGDGGIYYNEKFNIYQTTIAGHSEFGRDYLINYVKPLFEKTFGIKMSIKKSRKSKEILLRNQGKKLVKELNKLGLKIGNKMRIGAPPL